MATITIRLEDEEKDLIAKIAELKNQTISSFIKDNIMETIEDEFDYKVGEAALDEFNSKDNKIYSFDEMLTECKK